jgi:hypothetical protein
MKSNGVLLSIFILFSLTLICPASCNRIGKKSIMLPQDELTEQSENQNSERGLAIRSVSKIKIRHFC